MSGSIPKTLVIGSTGHQYVTCVEWGDVNDINMVDFETVVIQCDPLTDKFLKSRQYKFFEQIRKSLSRLLRSHGKVVAISDAYRRVVISDYTAYSNYSWSPITIHTVSEAGTTIEYKRKEFPKYFAGFKKWDFYFYVPNAALSSELTDVCGSTAQYH